MRWALFSFDVACQWLILALLRLATVIEAIRQRVPNAVGSWVASLRAVLRTWRRRVGLEPVPPIRRRAGRATHNRTPPDIEAKVAALKRAQPQLGAGQLRYLLERIHGHTLARETIRLILLRLPAPVRARVVRRIKVHAPRMLWGADLTRVMVLGLIPVWLLGVVDYHGSRLVALERLWWPTKAEVCRVFENAIAAHGAPRRILTDNGGQFRSLDFELMLVRHGVDHTFTKPKPPWTNGRIERLFRTFKETIFHGRWMLVGVEQLDKICADFVTFYNRDRPHSAYGGRTPDEVYFNLNFHRAIEPVTYEVDPILRTTFRGSFFASRSAG